MSLRVAYGNVHNNRAAIRRLLATNPDVLGLGEAYNRRPFVTHRPRYRCTMGAGARDQRRGAYDNPVLTRRTLRSLGQLAFEASEQSVPVKIAPDRWITVDVFVKAKPVACICVHPNANVKGLTTATPRVREYNELMRSLERVIDLARAEGWVPVLVGDVNFPQGGRSPDWLDPRELLAAKGMQTYWQGLDVIAWGSRLQRVGARTIPAKTLGSDHPGLVVDLK